MGGGARRLGWVAHLVHQQLWDLGQVPKLSVPPFLHLWKRSRLRELFRLRTRGDVRISSRARAGQVCAIITRGAE